MWSAQSDSHKSGQHFTKNYSQIQLVNLASQSHKLQRNNSCLQEKVTTHRTLFGFLLVFHIWQEHRTYDYLERLQKDN